MFLLVLCAYVRSRASAIVRARARVCACARGGGVGVSVCVRMCVCVRARGGGAGVSVYMKATASRVCRQFSLIRRLANQWLTSHPINNPTPTTPSPR